MLAYIKGPITLGDSFVVADVGGIGLKITATRNTIEKLKPKTDTDNVKILTYLHIQESKWEIFGFAEAQEREAFLLLLSCRGVGPKAALNILGSLPPPRLRSIALGEEPVTTLQQVPGIGAKSADRILVELKEKLPEMGGWGNEKKDKNKANLEYSHEDLFRALRNLGYRTTEIQMAISQSNTLPATLSEAVRQLLKALGKS
ncbi:MAG: Holliday junction branch migration protein RuvA [Candidatus Moraniibacteriota bacterium]